MRKLNQNDSRPITINADNQTSQSWEICTAIAKRGKNSCRQVILIGWKQSALCFRQSLNEKITAAKLLSKPHNNERVLYNCFTNFTSKFPLCPHRELELPMGPWELFKGKLACEPNSGTSFQHSVLLRMSMTRSLSCFVTADIVLSINHAQVFL